MKRYTPDFPEMMRLCETNFAQLRRLLPRTDAAGEKVSYQVGSAQYRLTIVESTRYTTLWGSFDLSDADACKALAHTDIPLLIIHGDEDMKAPLSMAYKLYDSCNGEKQLYIVHGADHTENYRKDPGGYEKIVTKFIEERLRQKKCQTPGTKP